MGTIIDINNSSSLIVECGNITTDETGVATIIANSNHGSNATLLLTPKNNSVTAFIISKSGLNFIIGTSFPKSQITYKITSTS